jgi:P27 family predicted phage terminase small subunit
MGRRGPQARNALAQQQNCKANAGTEAPAAVAADPVALEKWQTTVQALRDLRLWHTSDREVVARYSLLSAAWSAAYADVRERGPSMPTSTGYEAMRPAAVQLTKLAAALLSIESALGLNAKSRQRMSAGAAADHDDDDEETVLLRRLALRGPA